MMFRIDKPTSHRDKDRKRENDRWRGKTDIDRVGLKSTTMIALHSAKASDYNLDLTLKTSIKMHVFQKSQNAMETDLVNNF